MSRILLTDAEQLRSNANGVGFQVAAVLAGPNGGVTLELKHLVTEAREVILLTPEQVEVVVEQVTATLRCNAPDPHAKAVTSLAAWKARRAGHTCSDCDDSDLPRTCQIAERPHLMTRADEAQETFGRR